MAVYLVDYENVHQSGLIGMFLSALYKKYGIYSRSQVL